MQVESIARFSTVLSVSLVTTLTLLFGMRLARMTDGIDTGHSRWKIAKVLGVLDLQIYEAIDNCSTLVMQTNANQIAR